MQETITVPKADYPTLKKKTEVGEEPVNKIKKSLEDLKKGRFKKLA